MGNFEKEENRFDRIKELARMLPDGDGTVSMNEPIIDFVLKPIVKIERDRYDDLIKKETMLESIIRYSHTDKYISSDFLTFLKAVCGELDAEEKKEDKEE